MKPENKLADSMEVTSKNIDDVDRDIRKLQRQTGIGYLVGGGIISLIGLVWLLASIQLHLFEQARRLITIPFATLVVGIGAIVRGVLVLQGKSEEDEPEGL